MYKCRDVKKVEKQKCRNVDWQKIRNVEFLLSKIVYKYEYRKKEM